jgi:FkbM family methyltransferase
MFKRKRGTERNRTSKGEAVVFDIGMYEGQDTAYYLEMGFRVIAVEANPALVEQSRHAFKSEIRAGRLVLENCAVAGSPGTVALHVCEEDPGSSSLYRERLSNHRIGRVRDVPTIAIGELFKRYGIPYYMKVDIEGADRFCILPIIPQSAPAYLSFEMGDDAIELLQHLHGIGYRKFKIICQESFRELENVNCLRDRCVRRLRGSFGLADSKKVRRGNHRFVREHSSGPMPEHTDGVWRTYEETVDGWVLCKRFPRTGGWYDLHASLR